MRDYAISPAPIISLPIVGSDDRFPVRRIYCVGKNYRKHVTEMGGDPKNSSPVFFTKSRETIVQSGSTILMPPQTENLHYEVELVVALAGPKDIFGYGVGIDMTRRDLQAMAKQKGGPWDMAKNFDDSAPCSALVRAGQISNLNRAKISLTQNGEVKQSASLDQMIWSVDAIIAALGVCVTLAAGDLIFTGTPDGVGPVLHGDTLIGTIDGLPSIEVSYYGV